MSISSTSISQLSNFTPELANYDEAMDSQSLLEVSGLNKKFCKSIRHNMLYGMADIWQSLWGNKTDYSTLRPEEFWVLKNINLSVKTGEIVGIAGPNGSGKTSLIRIIANIYTHQQGEISFKPGIRSTAIFALQAGMHPSLSGRENIYIRAALYGMTKKEIEEKMTFIVSFSELEEKIDQPFGNYSSGMKARLAFSIAIATEPDIFIVDEALAVGDIFFKAKCFEYLKAYVAAPGRAVVFVSNNVRKLLKIATRAIIIKEGSFIYNSTDLKSALEYYVLNCLDHLSEEEKQRELKIIQKYES